jgi:hypothetical protein
VLESVRLGTVSCDQGRHQDAHAAGLCLASGDSGQTGVDET